jgi:DNA-binding CsgD family transcriptional regulator
MKFDRVLQELYDVANDEAVTLDALLRFADRIGFEHVAVSAVQVNDAGTVRSKPNGFQTNLPQAWLDEMSRLNHDARLRDPVLRQLQATSKPIVWDHTTYRGERLYERIQYYGIGSGIAVSVATGDPGDFLYLGFTSPHHTLPSRFLASQLSALAFAASLSIAAFAVPTEATVATPCPLTRRELEVLQWIQRGKTAWEIAQLLAIAENTVNNHVKTIKAKLGIVNRVQAVTYAERAGWLRTA